MNPLSYYDRSKIVWTEEESDQIQKEYVVESKTISEIGDAHRRTPGSVAARLMSLGVISHRVKARGYEDYKASSLYSEIIANSEKKKEDNATRKAEKEEEKKLKPLTKKPSNDLLAELVKSMSEINRKLDILIEKVS
jgi:hypothetical protein